MKRKIRHFEPFIFLPLENIQEKLFYINRELEEEYAWLKQKIFSFIGNEILFDNVMRVFQCKKSIIIVHIYPLQYRETISGRGGQVLVIGYIISRELVKKYYEGVLLRIALFFNLIEQFIRTYYKPNSCDIATDFVRMVNNKNCNREKIADEINIFVNRCNCNWNEYVWSKLQKISIICGKKERITIKISGNSSKLFAIYKYLQDRSFRTCIILLNCKDYTNYSFLGKKTRFVSIYLLTIYEELL